MSITFLAKNSTACPPGLVHSCRGLPRSPIGRGHRPGRHQRIVQTGNGLLRSHRRSAQSLESMMK